MNRKRLLAISAGAALAVLPGTASAHGDAEGVVLERHNLMSDVKDANQIASAMVRGKQALDRDELAFAAESIAELSRDMVKLFPDNEASRQGHGSNAKQKLWKEFDRFRDLSRALEDAANALAAAAGEAPETRLHELYRDLGDTCRNCHRSYRRKKN